MIKSFRRNPLLFFSLFLAYFVSGKMGLRFASVNPSTTAVWPPTGIALGALLVWGPALWPAVALGAFFVNLTTSGSIIASLGIATGNTLQALVGFLLVKQFAHGIRAFERPTDIFRFAFHGGLGSTIVSAAFGTTTLCLNGLASWSQYRSIWLTWWLGDSAGVLITAPLVILWLSAPPRRWTRRHLAEMVLLWTAVILLSLAVFDGLIPAPLQNFPLEFLCTPLVIWAAFRGRRQVATVCFFLSALATWGTVRGLGPFILHSANESLLLLQVYMAVISLMGTAVAAVVEQRTRTEQRLAVQYATSRVFVDYATRPDAVATLLKTVGEGLEWDTGAFWRVDTGANALRCEETWCHPNWRCPEFLALSRQMVFQPGVGLPGRVWRDSRAVWLTDLLLDPNFPRLLAAGHEGLRGAFAFPIRSAAGVLGVLEYFSHRAQPPDEDLLCAVEALGNQLGQFLEGRRAEHEMRESEERFRNLADTAPVLIWQSNPEGRFIFVNKPWLEYTGRSMEQELGQGWTQSIHPEDRPNWLAVYEEAFREKKSFQMEFRLRRHDGAYHWVVDSGIPRMTDGILEGYIGSCIDINDRKMAELEIQNLNNELERKVFERTAELHQKEEELYQSRKLEAVGRLAGGIAHDFNNLMTGITGLCEDMLSDSNLNIPRRADLEDVVKAALRASTLTKQLLALGRRQIAAPTILNINTLIADMKTMLQRVIGEDINLVTRLNPQVGNVKVDPGQVEQIVLNLVLNARDAMPKGGDITLESANEEVEEKNKGGTARPSPGSYVRLVISDTGSGMSAEVQAHAFEPFFTTKSKDKGSGLGLATVYGIVKQNGGEIFLYSELGAGTTFKIYLPRVAEVAHPPRSIPPLDLPRGNETILLVEDEDIVRGVTMRALRKQGYKVLEARDAKEGLEICSKTQGAIHLLLTDVIMPGMNGHELAKLVVAKRPEIKVLFMSGYPENIVVHQGIVQPGIAFIEKSFTSQGIVIKVREVLDAPRRWPEPAS